MAILIEFFVGSSRCFLTLTRAHPRAFHLARLVHEEDIINKHGNLTTSQDILIKPGSLLMRRQNLAVFLSTSHQRGA